MLHAETLGSLLDAAASSEPDAPAYHYRDETITYGDWRRLADRVADRFAAEGVGRGDVVALLLPSTPLYMVAYLAAARMGAVTTGINVRYGRHEIRHILQQSGAKLLLAVDAWHGASVRETVEGLDEDAPALSSCIWVGAETLVVNTSAAVDAIHATAGPREYARVTGEDPATIVFTSGTIGVPKGACYLHRNIIALADIETRRYAGGEIPFKKHLAAGLSFAHVGFMARVGIQIAHVGASTILDKFDPAEVLAVVEREGLVHLGGIPTQMVMLLDHPDRQRRDLSSLRSILLGGAASSPALIERLAETFDATISVRYSSTEVGIATASLPGDPPERLLSTVGKPTEGVELRVVDGDNQPVAADVVGEIVVRSPAAMQGYWRAPEATAEVIDTEGWVHTGDAGHIDPDGYVHVKGRQSDMYIRGGYNVFPEEIEHLLAKHPKVARAAVIGVPDEKFGEIGWAFIVASAGDVPTLAEVRDFVGSEMASFKRPDGLTVVDALPVTPMFKVDKKALRRQHGCG